jgi:hypothetical protein
MDGKMQQDPFSVGQLVGMMTILTFIENNNGINKDFFYKLKAACAEKISTDLEKPTEDVYLMIDELVKKIK